jgi:methenyltetrahydrofolate cyclohydrolase
MSDDPSQMTVGAFLDAVAARSTSPSAGAVAAVTVGSAAALAAMAARFAGPDLQELADRAEQLKTEAIRLAEADAPAYAEVLAALRQPKDRPGRREQVSAALRAATEIPLALGETGCEVATMAARLAKSGNRRLLGEAQTAATLAEGAVRATAAMVRANVELGDLAGTWRARAASQVRAAHDSATMALGSTG